MSREMGPLASQLILNLPMELLHQAFPYSCFQPENYREEKSVLQWVLPSGSTQSDSPLDQHGLREKNKADPTRQKKIGYCKRKRSIFRY
jgi:hypothetical protein